MADRKYSLTGEPAASRIERYLDTRKTLSNLDPEDVALVASTRSNHELIALTVSDLRAVLAELHDYQTGVKAVLALPPVKSRNTYAHGYDAAQADIRRTLAEHIPDVLDEKQ